MFKFLRRHRTVLMVTLAFVILGMVFFGIGTSFTASSADAIAKVNGQKVSQRQFDQLYYQFLRSREDITPEQRLGLAKEVFSELVRQIAFAQEAKRFGLKISDQELMMHLASIPAFQKEGKFDGWTYSQTVQRVFGMKLDEFENLRKNDLLGRKLNGLIASSVHIDEALFQAAYQNRLSILTDAEEKKKLQETPDLLRQEIRNEEINRVFNDWLAQLNAKLKVAVVSKNFEQRLAGKS